MLNDSSAMMAKQINKNDLNAVTAADTAGFSTDVVFDQADPKVAALAYIDYPTGDITKTAIAGSSRGPTAGVSGTAGKQPSVVTRWRFRQPEKNHR